MLYDHSVGTHGGNGADGTINTEGKGGKEEGRVSCVMREGLTRQGNIKYKREGEREGGGEGRRGR